MQNVNGHGFLEVLGSNCLLSGFWGKPRPIKLIRHTNLLAKIFTSLLRIDQNTVLAINAPAFLHEYFFLEMCVGSAIMMRKNRQGQESVSLSPPIIVYTVALFLVCQACTSKQWMPKFNYDYNVWPNVFIWGMQCFHQDFCHLKTRRTIY